MATLGAMSSRSVVRDVVATLDWADPPTFSPGADDLGDAATDLGDGPLRWVAGIVELGIADLLDGPDADVLAPWEELRPFVRAHLLDVLRGLTSGDGPESVRLAVFDPAFADVFARDVPLKRVLDTVATFHNRCLTALVEHAVRGGSDGEVIAAIVRGVTHVTNQWTQSHAERYLAESRRRIDSTHARTRAMVEALLAGDTVEPSAARALGVTLDGWHVGCVAAALPGRAMDARSVDDVAAAFVAATRTTSALRYETSTGQVWLWSSGARVPRCPAPDELAAVAPLVVGIGRPHEGPAGLRRTHVEAADAVRVARTSGASRVSRTVAIDDVGLVAMLTADAERARWFVDRELAGLAGDDEQSGDLRDTLRAFYAARMRVAPAAERLFLHRNTLINRLDRVEALLGHSVAERTAEVQAALLLHAVLPPATRAD